MSCGNCKCDCSCTPEKGDRGLPGIQGDLGIQGTQGLKGNTGNQGAQGEQGIQGEPGTPAPVFPLVVAYGQPTNINLTAASIGGARLCSPGAIVQPLLELVDDNNAYDPLTGIWTCQEDGYYDLNFWVHISDDAGLGTGRWKAGIMFANGSCNFACEAMVITEDTVKHLGMTGTNNAQFVTATTQYVLKIINVTTKNYSTILGDVAKMAIRRVR